MTLVPMITQIRQEYARCCGTIKTSTAKAHSKLEPSHQKGCVRSDTEAILQDDGERNEKSRLIPRTNAGNHGEAALQTDTAAAAGAANAKLREMEGNATEGLSTISRLRLRNKVDSLHVLRCTLRVQFAVPARNERYAVPPRMRCRWQRRKHEPRIV